MIIPLRLTSAKLHVYYYTCDFASTTAGSNFDVSLVVLAVFYLEDFMGHFFSYRILENCAFTLRTQLQARGYMSDL